MADQRAMVLRGGMVGCGFFGQIQAEAWRRMSEAEIVCACDFNIERARQTAPNAYSSLETMLESERLDFLDIATLPEAHLPLVRIAVERGIPVICQKPMAANWDDAVEMVRTAEAAGVPLMIHENWRWQPWYRVVNDAITRGDIGQPVAYCFRMRKRDGVGPEPYAEQPYFRNMKRYLIQETLVHAIDVTRFLFGGIRSVSAQTRRVNPVIAGEDQVVLTLSHRSSLLGLVDGHRFTDPAPNSPPLGDTMIEGESGVLRVSPVGDVYLGDARIWTNDVVSGYRGDCVLATQRHFVTCLRAGRPFETSGREYLGTFAAVEAAYRSAESGRVVELSEISGLPQREPEAGSGTTAG